jgi:HPt (histidine-containing phosphotransfer) domain-containing protein
MSTEPKRPRLDADALARLQELDPDGRHGVVRRVLEAFETSLVRMLVQLQVQASASDAVAVSRVAHTLKSSAASVGALALSQRCAEIEKKRRDGDAVGIEGDVAAMVAEAEAALVAVRAILRP